MYNRLRIAYEIDSVGTPVTGVVKVCVYALTKVEVTVVKRPVDVITLVFTPVVVNVVYSPGIG